MQMNSKIRKLLKSHAWRQAIHLIRSVAAIALTSICLLAITDVARTHTRTARKHRAENHALPVFGAVSGKAKSPGNLKLTDEEEDALVAFLKALTDGYTVPSPRTAK